MDMMLSGAAVSVYDPVMLHSNVSSFQLFSYIRLGLVTTNYGILNYQPNSDVVLTGYF